MPKQFWPYTLATLFYAKNGGLLSAMTRQNKTQPGQDATFRVSIICIRRTQGEAGEESSKGSRFGLLH